MATSKAASTDVAVNDGPLDLAALSALLPDLVATTTMEIEGSDVSFPRLKISHPSQVEFVPEVVPAFAIYSELNKDDDNKVTLFELKKGQTKPDFDAVPDAGILVYIVAMKKGVSANVDDAGNVVPRNTDGATFRSWPFYGQPGSETAPPKQRGVDVTYNYVVYAPELDAASKPHRILMTRTSTPTAVTINTFLQDAKDQGFPSYTVPFRIWSEKRERTDNGQKQYWGVFKARPVQPTLEDVQAASKMTAMVTELDAKRPEAKVFEATSVDEPAI